MKKKFDSARLGFGIGLILPTIILIATYFIREPGLGFPLFFKAMVGHHILSKMLSLCVYPNLIPFFFFIWTDRLQSARGVLGATIVLAIIVFLSQLIF
ncbi:MAG TPA: hypothetical protein VMW01_17035 [Williamwhitmania sp.]|nr:hypothetical protein [Williamwhitmania sp.]